MTFPLIARNLLRAPGFATLVLVTLAIGIGATTAMFSVVDAVLLRPLRFPGADRAVEVWVRSAEGGSAQPGLAGNVFGEVRRTLVEVAEVEGYHPISFLCSAQPSSQDACSRARMRRLAPRPS